MSDVSRRVNRLEEHPALRGGEQCTCRAVGGGILAGAIVLGDNPDPAPSRCTVCGGTLWVLRVTMRVVEAHGGNG